MSERIKLLHPDAKQGANIDRAKYDVVAQGIVESIGAAGSLPFKDLAPQVATRLPANFDGSIGWYTTAVKLDLEARGIICRIAGLSPQQLRLATRGESPSDVQAQ